MLTGLKGLVLKSENNEKGQTPYTIILGKNSILPWMYKTATLYKYQGEDSQDIKLVPNNRDSTKYRKGIKKNKFTKIGYEELHDLSEDLERLSEEEKDYLRKSIENIPQRIIRTFYDAITEPLFPSSDNNLLYGFEIQKVKNIDDPKIEINEPKHKNKDLESISRKLSNRLSEKFYNKLYKKAFLITHNFPL
ncbi:MAG: hypothetical protein ACP5NZ_04815 [Nanobdellota archaeon]